MKRIPIQFIADARPLILPRPPRRRRRAWLSALDAGLLREGLKLLLCALLSWAAILGLAWIITGTLFLFS